MNLAKVSDEKLALFMQENAGAGFEEVMDRYQNKLNRYVGGLVRDENQAEDIVQETFIAVYKNINSFDVNKKFSSWIYRIAHNKAINEIRKSRIFIGLDKAKEVVDENHDSQKIEKEIDKADARKLIEKSLNKLSIKYREVIILRFFEDRSYEEISDILRIPKNTVGVRIKRGLEELKRRLNINVEDYL